MTRPMAVLFTESRFRPDNLFYGLAKAQIHMRPQGGGRVSRAASKRGRRHGRRHVAVAAPLRCAASDGIPSVLYMSNGTYPQLDVLPLSRGNIGLFAPQGQPVTRWPHFFRHKYQKSTFGRFLGKVRLESAPSDSSGYNKVGKKMSIFLLTACRFSL